MTSSDPRFSGRVTLPVEEGMDDELAAIIDRLGADAVRNSDGTWLPKIVSNLGTKVYSTRFCARGDEAWALDHLDEHVSLYLCSDRVPALEDGPLEIHIMRGFFAEQVRPDTDVDVKRWWQVRDRTTDEVIDDWTVSGEGADCVVAVPATAGHVYTVAFLAAQLWDTTQMYNYTTNHWENDPTRSKEHPFDVVHPATWNHVQESLSEWLDAHPEVDVVRFTTFFYHFTLYFNEQAKEKFVDWFGYSASVSVPLMEAFEAETGWQINPEDFIDAGYHNSSFRPPSQFFLAWIDFVNRFVTDRVRRLVEICHDKGREAMMFLGDNWIGTEPYGELFATTGLDAVVGSVGSSATCRMISDIPGVHYTEGRFLPYFFPDVFNDEGDPVGEANTSWVQARRAIVRKPLDRIGYGGYLSLANQYPEFMERIEQICQEFRDIWERSGGKTARTAPFRIGILNCWGARRTWMSHMACTTSRRHRTWASWKRWRACPSTSTGSISTTFVTAFPRESGYSSTPVLPGQPSRGPRSGPTSRCRQQCAPSWLVVAGSSGWAIPPTGLATERVFGFLTSSASIVRLAGACRPIATRMSSTLISSLTVWPWRSDQSLPRSSRSVTTPRCWSSMTARYMLPSTPSARGGRSISPVCRTPWTTRDYYTGRSGGPLVATTSSQTSSSRMILASRRPATTRLACCW